MNTQNHHPLDKLPPHDEEIEAAALGCLLLQPEDFARATSNLGLNRRSFYTLRHQNIFDAMLRICAEGKVPDLVTISSELKRDNKLDDVGGLLYIGTLPDKTPSAVMLDQYVEQLNHFRVRRDLILQASSVLSRAQDLNEPLDTLQDDLQRAIALSNQNSNALPEIEDAAAFVQRKIDAPRELVWGLLHQGAKMVVGAGSKGCKTWTMIDLAISVALGEPWLSIKTSRGKVLYLNFELQEFDMQKRLNAVAKAKNAKFEPGQIDVWNLRGRVRTYNVLFPKILERIKTCDYSMIVIDPIYKSYGDTDENSAAAVAMLMNAIEDLAVQTGAAVAFAAHFAKGNAAGKESIDRISGSGVFARDPDCILSFTRHETDHAFTVEATLRSFKPMEPFVVRWDYPLMRRDRALDPSRLKQKPGPRKRFTVEKIIRCLGGQKLSAKSWCILASSELGISKTQFYAVLEEARSHPNLKQTPEGQWYYEEPEVQSGYSENAFPE
jgi:hypothetical protein